MPVISNNSTSSLPFFVENQILRANDLNALVQGLMEELRQNRTYNIGIGIVNGLNVTVEDNRHLKITTGFGISSDGYTFETNECTITHIRSAEGLTQCKVSSLDCEEYRQLIENMGLAYELTAFDDSDPNSSPDEINTGGWQEIESFPITATDNTVVTADGIEIDQGFCLLFIWCEEEVARTSCFNDCEQKGADQNASLKVVLFPRKKYEEIFSNDTEEENQATEVILPAAPNLPRFGYDNERCIKLCEITDWNRFYEEYRVLCEAIVGNLDDPNEVLNPTNLLGLYHAAYTQFYEPATNATTTPFDGLELFLKNKLIDLKYTANGLEECLDIQYLYTYLQELILAYESFRAIANGMTLLGNSNDSGSDINCLFPKHISLGAFTATEDLIDENQNPVTGVIAPVEPASAGDPPVCRSDRRLPDVFPQTLERKEKALSLFERMVAMTTEGNVLLPTSEYSRLTDLRLTPDIRRFPYLNSRAIPFYMDNLTTLWRSPDTFYPSILRYLDRSTDHILFSEVEPYDFYRIEGHLGRNLEDALNKIEDHKSCFNIAFDVRAVRIGPGTNLTDEQRLSFKDLESWFYNTRHDIICKLKEAYDDREPSDYAQLLFDEFNRFPELQDFPFPFVNEPDCCDNILPEIDPEYLRGSEELLGYYASVVLPNGESLDPDIGNCIVDIIVEFKKRELAFMQQNSFPCFAKTHPGLEHRGGVPRGGTFVIVYKQSENGDTLVVADFSLPYLCCSEGVVIRNEIRKINNELVIPKVVFCFDTASTSNAPIVGTVAPFGGDLTISSPHNGATLSVNVNQADGSFAVTYEDLFVNASPNFIFSNGEAILIFEYEVGGTTPESKTVTVYKKPVLNCDEYNVSRAKQYLPYNPDVPSESCRFTGYLDTISLLNSPVDLNQVDEFYLSINGQTIYLKDEAQTYPQGNNDQLDMSFEYNAAGELIGIQLSPQETSLPLIFTATKGDCTTNCDLTIDAACLKTEDVRYVSYTEYTSTIPDETLLEEGQDSININTIIEEDPGFFVLKMCPTGFSMGASVTNADGNVTPVNIILEKLSAAENIDCEDRRLYAVIYNKEAAAAYTPLEGVEVFTAAELDGITNFEENPSPIQLSYTAYHLELCEPITKNLTVNILNPQPIPADDGDGGNDDDETSDSDITARTDDTSTSDTDESTDTSGSRGLSSALLSPTGNQLSAEANQLLNQRRAAQMEQLNHIRQEQADIAKLAGFRYATSLISLQADEATLEAAYRKALNPLFTSYTRTDDKARKATLEQLIVATHHALLDKLTVQTQDIGTDTLASIAEQMQKTAKAGISLQKLKRSWKASALRKVFDKNRVNLLNRIIKT